MNSRWCRGFCRNSSSMSGDVAADQAYGFGAHAAQIRVLLQQHEHFEQGGGVAREHFRMGHFQVIVADLEARIDGHAAARSE